MSLSRHEAIDGGVHKVSATRTLDFSQDIASERLSVAGREMASPEGEGARTMGAAAVMVLSHLNAINQYIV